MKKFFICIGVLALFFSLFSTRIIGEGIKLILKLKYDCDLAYRSIEWEEGELVFSNLVIFDPAFHTHMEKARLSFDYSALPRKLKGHLTVEAPHLTLSKFRSFEKGRAGFFDFSLSVRNGVSDWGGPLHFSLDHTSSASQLTLEWKGASALITLQGERVDAVLHDLDLTLLKPWISFGEILDGNITGHIAMDLEKTPLSAHLEIAQGAFALPGGAVEDFSATLSYNQGVGGKWEAQGFGKAGGKQFPFTSTGRGFFRSEWLESEIRFDTSHCKVSKEGAWSLICEDISAHEATWLQAALGVVWPEIASYAIEEGIISGQAIMTELSWETELKAEDLKVKKGDYHFTCERAFANFSQDGGSFSIEDSEYSVRFAGLWEDWRGEARLGSIELDLKGGWDGEKSPIEIEVGKMGDLQFQGKGWIDPHLNGSFAIEGDWTFLKRKIPFYCPLIKRQNGIWAFDFRCSRKTWDLFRLTGTYDGKEMSYKPVSHFLGQPLAFHSGSLGEIDFSFNLPWKSALSAAPFLKEWGVDLHRIPPSENTEIRVQYQSGKVALMAQGINPPFTFKAQQKEDDWEIELSSDLNLSAHLKPDGSVKGEGKWKEAIQAEFEGKIDPSLSCKLSFANASLDLQTIPAFDLKGKAFGGGHFIYNERVEADFDFDIASFMVQSYKLENEGQIHLSYRSDDGVLIKGLHLHGPLDCVVDLLEYDIAEDHWIFHNGQIHFPPHFFSHPLLQKFDLGQDLNLTANFDFSTDFSLFACTVQELALPYKGAFHQINDLDLVWNNGKCKAALHYLNQPVKVYLQTGDKMGGRLIFGEEEIPLTLDWEYDEKVLVQSIEGTFHGLDASFHAESPNVLVGSARIDFKALSPLLPIDVARVFHELKMGQGYELKGRLKIEENLPYFQGILSGKAIELFGFQFRTLLAQAELSLQKVWIRDLKVSDSAGSLKVDEILIEDHSPWMIAIPHLTILEMRPSLLLRPGGKVGPIDPLVVRYLKMDDFKGELENGKTYTAKGDLHFINSYKREETVFDLPANVLGRIVGIDLELLIPVTGDLTFEIRDGYVHLLELQNAYSEGKRSQFFLEADSLPKMDLDGNLEILIKMKQFVLFKITESFLISVEGVLDDPKFHLRKRRFFGLM